MKCCVYNVSPCLLDFLSHLVVFLFSFFFFLFSFCWPSLQILIGKSPSKKQAFYLYLGYIIKWSLKYRSNVANEMLHLTYLAFFLIWPSFFLSFFFLSFEFSCMNRLCFIPASISDSLKVLVSSSFGLWYLLNRTIIFGFHSFIVHVISERWYFILIHDWTGFFCNS